MKKLNLIAIITLIYSCVVTNINAQETSQTQAITSITTNSILIKAEKPGLLILSHGSPSPKWNESVNTLVTKVDTINKDKKAFHAVAGSFLEFAKPDASDGVKKLETAGCDHIIVVPFFIAPSSHSHFDVPATLGLYSSPSTRNTIIEEQGTVAHPTVPVTIVQTLSEGTLLDSFVLDAVKELSQSPKDEAFVLIAHGDSGHYNMVNSTMKRIVTYCCGQTGIDHAQWAYCGIGQTFLSEVAPLITETAEKKTRVIVVGLYVASSADSIKNRTIAMRGPNGKEMDPFEGKTVVFSKKSVVDYSETPAWIYQAATDALAR